MKAINRMTREQTLEARIETLNRENAELREAVSYNRKMAANYGKQLSEANQALLAKLGDDYCWLDNLRHHPDFGKIPPKEEFLKSCEAYYSQIAEKKGVLTNCPTMRQLIESNAELREEATKALKLLERLIHFTQWPDYPEMEKLRALTIPNENKSN